MGSVLTKLKSINFKFKSDCLSSCCITKESEIHIDIDKDGKDDIIIKGDEIEINPVR